MSLEEYYVSLVCKSAVLHAVQNSELLHLPPDMEEKLKMVDSEIRELQRRLGGSGRRKVNAVLTRLGYPAVEKA